MKTILAILVIFGMILTGIGPALGQDTTKPSAATGQLTTEDAQKIAAYTACLYLKWMYDNTPNPPIGTPNGEVSPKGCPNCQFGITWAAIKQCHDDSAKNFRISYDKAEELKKFGNEIKNASSHLFWDSVLKVKMSNKSNQKIAEKEAANLSSCVADEIKFRLKEYKKVKVSNDTASIQKSKPTSMEATPDLSFVQSFWWLIALIGAAIGVMAGYFWAKSIENGRENKPNKDSDRQGYNSKGHRNRSDRQDESINWSNTTTYKPNGPAISQDEFRRMEIELAALKVEYDRLRQTAAVANPIDAPYQAPEAAPANILFFAAPSAEGVFNGRYAHKEYDPMKTRYQVRVNHDGNSGELTIYNSDSAFKPLLSYASTELLPVGDPQNALKEGMRRIEVESPGHVELDNGNWRVTKKIKYRYA